MSISANDTVRVKSHLRKRQVVVPNTGIGTGIVAPGNGLYGNIGLGLANGIGIGLGGASPLGILSFSN
jgi:hypothetical protein